VDDMTLVETVQSIFNNPYEVFDSASITDQCSELQGMDANQAHMPTTAGVNGATTTFAGHSGAKIMDKFRDCRGPLSISKQHHTVTGQNDPDKIWEFAKGSSGVPRKAIAYMMYVFRDADPAISDQTSRLLPEAAQADGAGTYSRYTRTPKKSTEKEAFCISPEQAALLREIMHPAKSPETEKQETAQRTADTEGQLLDNIVKYRTLKRYATDDGDTADALRYTKRIRALQIQLGIASPTDFSDTEDTE